MKTPTIAWRHRLATRQIVPVLAGFVGLVILLLALSYLYFRDQVILVARHQVSQLVEALGNLDSDYSPADFKSTVASWLPIEGLLIFRGRADGTWLYQGEKAFDRGDTFDGVGQFSPDFLPGSTPSGAFPVEFLVNYNHCSYLGLHGPGEGGGWLVLIPTRQLFAPLNRVTYCLAGLGAVGMLLAAMSLYRGTARLLAPLNDLNLLAARLASGDLEEIPPSYREKPDGHDQTVPPDEMQRLLLTLEKMRQGLRQRAYDLELIGKTTERLFGELTWAQAIVEKLRPPKLPPIADLELSAFVHTAGEVCGDMYDYFLCGPRKLACLMGNMAARGVPAALLSGCIGPVMHELLLSGLSPSKALDHLNRMMAATSVPDQPLVSVLAGLLDLDRGTFSWACAGQLPPFSVFKGQMEQLAWTGNTPLGIRPGEEYVEYVRQLQPGEMLLFSGQRLMSVTGEAGGEYTEKHLRKFLEECGGELPNILRGLYADIKDKLKASPVDDLTFFAFRWRDKPGERVD